MGTRMGVTGGARWGRGVVQHGEWIDTKAAERMMRCRVKTLDALRRPLEA